MDFVLPSIPARLEPSQVQLLHVSWTRVSFSSSMADGPEAQPSPPAAECPAQAAAGVGCAKVMALERNKTSAVPKRLTYDGPPGTAANDRHIKIVTQCMQYKSTLLGNGKKVDIYNIIAADLNKHHPELFYDLLKAAAVGDLWNKALKESTAQQVEKEEKRHLWYNGSVLHEMSSWEKLLDELFIEKRTVEERTEAEKLKEQEAETDKQQRLKAVFEQVDRQYQQGLEGAGTGGKGGTTDEDGKPAAVTSGPSPPAASAAVSPPATPAEKSYGRGQKEGNKHVSKGNAGLLLDARPDKLSQACEKQAAVAESISGLISLLSKEEEVEGSGKRKMTEFEAEQVKVRKMEAQTALLETWLKFKQSGMEIPSMLQSMLDE